MKRLVWLVLIAFFAAVGQVQAVGAKAKSCHCCHCDMPGCCPPPASAPAGSVTVTAAHPAQSPSLRKVRVTRAQPLKISLADLAMTIRQRLTPRSEPAPAAIVPLFTAHCSRLI